MYIIQYLEHIIFLLVIYSLEQLSHNTNSKMCMCVGAQFMYWVLLCRQEIRSHTGNRVQKEEFYVVWVPYIHPKSLKFSTWQLVASPRNFTWSLMTYLLPYPRLRGRRTHRLIGIIYVWNRRNSSLSIHQCHYLLNGYLKWIQHKKVGQMSIPTEFGRIYKMETYIHHHWKAQLRTCSSLSLAIRGRIIFHLTVRVINYTSWHSPWIRGSSVACCGSTTIPSLRVKM